MRFALAFGLLASSVLASATLAEEISKAQILDTMERVSDWPAQGSDSVQATSSTVVGATGSAVRLTYDFGQVSGYAFIRRGADIRLPKNFLIRFKIRGGGGANDLQFKLTAGDTVWWKPWVNFRPPAEWTAVEVPAGDIEFAWGPDNTIQLGKIDGLEFVVARNRDGGSGWIEIDDIELVPLTGEPVKSAKAEDRRNDLITARAKESKRGLYPRAFVGEQPYWTLAGSDGGKVTALMSEDGAIEPAKGSFSIEPFIYADDALYGWHDVKVRHSLAEGFLPIPTAHWTMAGLNLETSLIVAPKGEGSVATYHLTNTGTVPRSIELQLAVRPMQVNPPAQFLAQKGGATFIDTIAVRDGILTVDWRPDAFADKRQSYIVPQSWPVSVTAAPDMLAMDNPILGGKDLPRMTGMRVNGGQSGMASATMGFPVDLEPGETETIAIAMPNDLEMPMPDWEELHRTTADYWRQTLGKVQISVPKGKEQFVQSIYTAQAHMLMSRDGPMLKPGTRSYNRAWIRDGAMMSEGLLRMGRADVARDFANWYRGYLFSNGKVPCCVDFRGSDPVPENDSHGQYIFLATQLYRYTGDRAALEADWPSVRAAWTYMESLRQSERTAANLTPDRRMLYGLMPASISHEGYSAKAQYSLWDDFWALRGYNDAAMVAALLNKPEATQMAAARDEFRADLLAAIAASQSYWGINFIPGATSLGDFDATSTTIALDPGGAQLALMPLGLEETFDHYWANFVARRDGAKPWKDYTPYELRTVSAFTRLGWRDRTQELLAFFFQDQRPHGWNQWAEVVGRDPREIRFIGDMPHAWVASDYLRGALDIFVFEEHESGALVLGGGMTPDWFVGQGSAVKGLVTPYGTVDLEMRGTAKRFALSIDGNARPTGGFRFAWPFAGKPPKVQIDGRAAAWMFEKGQYWVQLPARGQKITVTIG